MATMKSSRKGIILLQVLACGILVREILPPSSIKLVSTAVSTDLKPVVEEGSASIPVFNIPNTYQHQNATAAIPQINSTTATTHISSTLPTAIVHVGPCKVSEAPWKDDIASMISSSHAYWNYWMDCSLYQTGTTAIQSSLKTLMNEFEQDNYFVGYGGLSAFMKDCLRHGSHECHSNKMMKRIHKARQQGNNLFISREHMASRSWTIPSKLRSILDGFDPQVIMVYRRFFEWLVSWHGQQYRVKWDRWESAMNPEDRSIADYFTPERVDHRMNVSFPTKRRAEFEEAGFTVHMVNYHEFPNKIVSGLLCLDVIHAPHVCSAASVDTGEAPNANRAEPISYDEIALAAYDKGWIDGAKVSRSEARVAIRKYIETNLQMTDTELPQKCLPTESLDHIRQRSLSAEEELFPDFYQSEEGKDVLLDTLENFATTNFCGIDTAAVLDWKNMTDFLTTLSKTQ